MSLKLGPYLLGPNEENQGVYLGDARELAKMIPNESVDLIFTDPPYSKKHLSLYGWLARESARILKPSGFCLAMCGGLYLNQVFALMDEHLAFFWKYEVYLSGWAAGCIWPDGNTSVNIVTRTKPILAYRKGKALPRTSTLGLFSGTGNDKRYHAWGQDEASARYYIDCFTTVGQVVFDPFSGGGTTPAMSRVLHRHWLAFDRDPEAIEKTLTHIKGCQPMLFPPKVEQMELSSNTLSDKCD